MATPRMGDQPLIPMPPITPSGLRQAVAQLAPSRLPSFVEHLEQATEQAAAQSTVAPIRSFLQWWAEFVAIQRRPGRAARLAELEGSAATAPDEATLRPLLAEIRAILDDAQREAA